VLVHAVLESQSTAPGNVLGAVRRTHMVGITGPLAFDKNGDLSGGPYTVYRLDGNEWNVVKIIAGE
jgi:branched-chain amino acid transport system substrate-binding protein